MGEGREREEAMSARVNGIHHVTSGVAGAQEDIDFFTQVVGQRMIKQTVLFDGEKPIYHLYYANKHAQVGSVMTCFPFRQAGLTGRKGTGQIQTTCYSVPVGSLKFWTEHMARHKVKHGGVHELFGQKRLDFSHPAGLDFAFVEDAHDKTEGWTTDEISADVAVRGFHSVVMSVRDTEEQERFFVDGLGFTKQGHSGAFIRFHINEGGAQKTVDLHHEPDRKQGSWTFAQGLVHHIAFAVPTEKEQTVVKAHLEGLGYTDVSEIKDRNYFHSIYCRSPSGVLCEIATCDIGFAIDEPKEHLGEKSRAAPKSSPRSSRLRSRSTAENHPAPSGARAGRVSKIRQHSQSLIGRGSSAADQAPCGRICVCRNRIPSCRRVRSAPDGKDRRGRGRLGCKPRPPTRGGMPRSGQKAAMPKSE
jgi:glyoxalase family protein